MTRNATWPHPGGPRAIRRDDPRARRPKNTRSRRKARTRIARRMLALGLPRPKFP